jgi:hypothetical protein
MAPCLLVTVARKRTASYNIGISEAKVVLRQEVARREGNLFFASERLFYWIA